MRVVKNCRTECRGCRLQLKTTIVDFFMYDIFMNTLLILKCIILYHIVNVSDLFYTHCAMLCTLK